MAATQISVVVVVVALEMIVWTGGLTSRYFFTASMSILVANILVAISITPILTFRHLFRTLSLTRFSYYYIYIYIHTQSQRRISPSMVAAGVITLPSIYFLAFKVEVVFFIERFSINCKGW